MHLLDPERPGGPRRLQAEGINFPGVWEQQALLDVDAIACNDVHAMLTTYGVEAARATILKEVQVRACLHMPSSTRRRQLVAAKQVQMQMSPAIILKPPYIHNTHS